MEPLGRWEFLDMESWQPTTLLPYGLPVHFIVARDPAKDVTLDVRNYLPITIQLTVDGLAAPPVKIEGSPADVCRGADGCSMNGPVIPREWEQSEILLEAYGEDGTLLARYSQ